MEKISPKMAAAFGVGFMGFILAAYSYNQQHKEEYIPTDDDNDVRNKVINTEKNKEHLEKNDKLNKDLSNNKINHGNTDTLDENIKNEVNDFLTKEKKRNWGEFWKNEYTRSKKIKSN
tara:strand:- start:101 stop:454 length:354 start_codon:yes stop_codon:yes gene_type:complete